MRCAASASVVPARPTYSAWCTPNTLALGLFVLRECSPWEFLSYQAP